MSLDLKTALVMDLKGNVQAEIKKLEDGLEKVEKELDKTGKAGKRAGKGLHDGAKGSGRFKAAARKMNNELKTSVTRLTNWKTATGLMVAVLVAITVKTAAFQQSMAEVSTLLDDTSDIDSMSYSVRELARAYGSGALQQSGALYQAISAGAASGAEAVNLLDTANRLAIGGVTDIETAVDGLTSVMNAYGPSVGTAADVSDTMFVAMKAGKTTIKELAGSVGQVTPLAAQLGVSFEELLSATAALTKGGLKTTEAMTQQKAMLSSILKPTAEAQKISKQLGLEFNATALKSKGLAGFLQDVKEKTGGNVTTMGKLFEGTEALSSALSLTGNQAGDFNATLDAMKNKTGATDRAFEKMKKTFTFQWNKVKETVIDVGRAIGLSLLPPMTSFLTMINESIEGWAKFLGLTRESKLTENILEWNAQLDDLLIAKRRLDDGGRGLSRQSLHSIEAEIQKLNSQLLKANQELNAIRDPAYAANQAIKTLEESIDKAADAAGGAGDSFSDMKSELETFADGVKKNAVTPLQQIQNEIERLNKASTAGFFKEDKGIAAYNNRLGELHKQMEAITRTDAEKAIDEINASVLKATKSTELYSTKLTQLWALYGQGDLTLAQYDKRVRDLSDSVWGDLVPSLKDAADQSEVTWKTIADSIGENLVTSLQQSWGTFWRDIFGGKGIDSVGSFVDTMKSMFINAIADIAAAWTQSKIFSAMGIEVGAPTGSVLGAIGKAISGSTIGKTVAGWFGGGAAAATTGGATAIGMGAAAPLAEEAAFVAMQTGGTAAVSEAAISLEAVGGAGEGVVASMNAATGATSGMSAGMASLGLAAFGVAAAMAFKAAQDKRMAQTTAEVTAKFAEATDVINTNALTYGKWGNEGLIALNDVHGGAHRLAQTLRDVDVSAKIGNDGMLLLNETTADSQIIVENYSDSVSMMLEDQMFKSTGLKSAMEAENDVRDVALQKQKEITEEWVRSLNLVNSTDFDSIIEEFSRLTGESEATFRAMSADGFITANELATKFNWSADQIEFALGGATSSSVTEFLRLLGIATGAAGGIKSGFTNAANGMSDVMVSGVGTIQNAINSLKGTSVTSTHDIFVSEHRGEGGEGGNGFAKGTGGKFITVPPGYPNDSYPIFLESDEDFMVRTSADRRRGVGFGRATEQPRGQSGNSNETERLLIRLIEIQSRSDGKLGQMATLNQEQLQSQERAVRVAERNNARVEAGGRR